MSMERKNRWELWLVMALAFALLALWGLRVSKNGPSDRFLKAQRSAPAFSLLDQEGKKFSSDTLKGKVWVVDFIFTRCAGSCPLLSGKMRQLQVQWKGNDDLKLVSISVDPEYDKPSVLKKYAEGLQADPDQWTFLTGEKADVYDVIQKGFQVTAEKDPDEPKGFEFVHSTRMILVDANGMIRGLYNGDEEGDVHKLQRDIHFLMSSKDKS